MSEEQRRRGRPRKADALTPAQRMQRTRARAVAVLNETEKAADLPDSALLELVRIAYRDSLSEVLAEAVTELFARMPKPYPVRLRPSFEQVRNATVTETADLKAATVTDNKTATVAGNAGRDSATVTQKLTVEPVTVTEKHSATVTEKEPPIPATVAQNQGADSATVTQNRRRRNATVMKADTATVAENDSAITATVAQKTERDARIRALAAEGKSGRAIARELGIGETTVRRVLARRPQGS